MIEKKPELLEGLSRREFLSGSLAAVAAFYSLDRLLAAETVGPDLWTTIPKWEREGAGRKVVVLGGGVGGMVAAYSLREAGFEPIVLERTGRAGGRVMTLRNHFGDQYAELGATRIPETHALTRAYASKLGLPLVEYPFDGANHLYYLGGHRFNSQGAYPSEFVLTADEKKLKPEALRRFYTSKAYAEIGDPKDPLWPSQSIKQKFDGKSFLQSQRDAGASANAAAICRAFNGTEIEMFSSLVWLAAEKRDEAWQRTYAIEGGMDRLASELAKTLNGKFVKNAKVLAVEENDLGVRVTYEHKGRRQFVDGDYVVSAIPHRLLSQITFKPGLSEKKAEGLRAVPMQKVARLNYQFAKRFWNTDEKLKGLLVSCSDLPVERLWDLTSVQKGTRGILTSYIQHENALKLGRFESSKQILDFGLDEIKRFFPAAKEHLVKSYLWEWHKQSWTEGAWAAIRREQIDYLRAFQQPEGRVHFVGDHTSVMSGWIQGTLESAHFAVAEIVNRARAGNRVGRKARRKF